MFSVFKTIIITLILAYVVIVILAAIFQRQMSYFPGRETFNPKEWDLAEIEPLIIRQENGLELKSWYRRPVASDNPTVIFFQGNALHPGYRNIKIRPWLDAGYGVLLVGYPGYGGNSGSPTETGIYNASRAALNKIIKDGVKESRLVFYGESIGTGPAVQMATEYKAAALILEAPFTSLPDAGAYHYPYFPVHIIMQDRFDSLSKIKQVKMPLLLIHGENDGIVPIKLGRTLFEAANEPKKAVFISQAGHNDLYDWGAKDAVMDFLASTAKKGLLSWLK